ncbi:DMT family transporter [Helcobacillus massiliensis]
MSRQVVLGFAFTLASAFFFAVSGAVAKTMYATGWTPGSVAFVRLTGASLLLAAPTLWQMRGRWGEVREHWRTVLIYGLAAMAGCQGFYFVAVQELTVTVALLLEMTAPIMIVFYLWAATRVRPVALTFLGVIVSMAGVVLVLDFRGAHLTGFGVVMALLAAVCLAIYFLVSSQSSISLPPFAFTGLGMTIGAVVIAALNLLGVMPAVFRTADVVFAGRTMSWLWPLAMLVLFTIGAYGFGILGLRLVGATVGAFVNLVEVPLAALAAWFVLGELPTSIQLVGGVFILIGIALVKWGDVRAARAGTPETRAERRARRREERAARAARAAQPAAGASTEPLAGEVSGGRLPTGEFSLPPEMVDDSPAEWQPESGRGVQIME